MMILTSSVARVAVVTGANKGVGFFIALQLGLSGLFSHVVLACRDASRGEGALADLQQQHQEQQQANEGVKTKFVCYAPLELGNTQSHIDFAQYMESSFGKVDVLINNAGMAYKNADPTPFAEQCTPTLNVNYRGTVDLTERLLPLIRLGDDPRIINVASMAGYLGQLKSKELRQKFTSPALTIPQLNTLVDQFENHVVVGKNHKHHGWGNSNYGLSKLALIAATKVWTKENPDIRINCCCPGWCRTDMTSQAVRAGDPAQGARNAVLPAIMENPPSGEFFRHFEISEW